MKIAMLLAGASLLFASAASAGPSVPLGSFNSIQASDGAKVTVVHGGAQSVTLVAGNTQFSRLEVHDGKLEIVGCAVHHCAENYRLEVEIVTPAIAAIEAEDGASIEARGDFPAQSTFTAFAHDGGNVNARAVHASNADVKAEDGGVVQVTATRALTASASDGGNIEYWGSPVVNIHSSDGGVVRSGS